ncbi:integrase/recombinase xerD homolog [Podarcis muralis]
MASGGDQQASTSTNQLPPPAGNGGAQVVDIPSVFQEQQPQHSSTEDSAGSGEEEEQVDPQGAQPAAGANPANVEKQGGERKSKKKHTSAKKKRSKQSETEDESDGALPLISAGRGTIINAFPGAPLESWEQEVMKGVFGAVAPSTMRSYKKAWADFLKFRSRMHSSRQNAIPSTREVLHYLAHLKELGRAPKTLNIQSAGISYFCKTFFATDPCAEFIVRKTLEGWRRAQPPSSDKRRPITYDILTQIHKKLRAICWSKYEARLFSAAYSIAFFGALRIGELVCEGGVPHGQRGILLSDLTLSGSQLLVQVRSSKTDQQGRGALIQLPAAQGSGPCPVRDTRCFLYLRPSGPGPLFIHADGSLLARHQFTRVMRRALSACGLPAAEFAAHSFRIGAATTAVHLGLSTERIKDLGRWKSDAYRAYVRKNL